jgi:hypothetical protein
MTHRIAIVILTGSSLALAAPPPEAPPPKLIDIYRANADPALPRLPSRLFRIVYSLIFSPDEQWLAVTLSARATGGGLTSIPNILLLLPLHPAGSRRVEIDADAGYPVLWSPDSRSVVVRASLGRVHSTPRMYNLRGELLWTGPPSGSLLGFIAPGRVLVSHNKADRSPAGFDTIDIPTSAVTPWPAPRHWAVPAIDSKRGLLAVFPDPESSKTLIVDYATGKIVQSLNNQNLQNLQNLGMLFSPGSGDWVYFAESGKTLCDVARAAFFRDSSEKIVGDLWLG